MNRIVQQMARAMLDESRTHDTFWGEATHTAVNILNKDHVCVNSDKICMNFGMLSLPL